MSAALKNKLTFVKMSGAGNDFAIFDARKNNITLTPNQIQKISDRKNIGCDQLIILRNSDNCDALMEIYNSDGSMSGACGNATRCVASIILDESKKPQIKIKAAERILECKKNGDLISVNMGKAKFLDDVKLYDFDFSCVDVGNPHAITFIPVEISDAKFFEIGPKVEKDKYFPNKTNVEFARILADDLIAVRVFERGAGETLACGSGACAVGALAIKKSLVKSKKVTVRFKGGDLQIEILPDDSIIMTGGYEKIFSGEIDANFLS